MLSEQATSATARLFWQTKSEKAVGTNEAE